MPLCPVCLKTLTTARQREGIYFFCDVCHGRAVTVPQLRRVAGDRFATQLLRLINRVTANSARACPFCQRLMKQFTVRAPPLTLDSCKHCSVIWFDPSEFEAVPEGGLEPIEEVELRGREALAVEKIKKIAEQARAEDDLPEEKWKWVAAFIGLPVKLDEPGMKRLPWVTWSLSAGILLVSVFAFFNLDETVARFGLVPVQVWRRGGFTMFSSFFLHAGVWHLLGNLYFLLLFGGSVEDYLGRTKYLLLIVLALLGADLLAVLLQPHSVVPSIGASGGISGVIAFYALEFPRSRLAFFLRWTWVSLPAWGAFAVWVLIQLFEAWKQLAGVGEVSGLAHLGGAVVGFLWWLACGDSLRIGSSSTDAQQG